MHIKTFPRIQEYYWQDVATPNAPVASLNRIINSSFLNARWTHWELHSFICLLMKKNKTTPICTGHLFLEITHRQFRKLTQQSPLSFTGLVYSCIWQVIGELFLSHTSYIRVVSFVLSRCKSSGFVILYNTQQLAGTGHRHRGT